LRFAIFTLFTYPFHVDMLRVLCDKVEAKIFTCGIYRNYPFEELLRHTEVLKCIDLAGSKAIEPLGLAKFLRYKPNAVVIFGIESLAGLTIYMASRLVKAKVLVVVEENNITSLSNHLLSVLQKFKRQVVRLVYKRAPILVAESHASKKYVLEILRVKRDTPTMVRVHGIDTKKYSKFASMPNTHAKTIMLKILGLSKDLLAKKWCTFIGETSYYKGADVLLEAIEILKEAEEIVDKVIFLFPRMELLRDRKDLKERYEQKLRRLVSDGFVTLYDPIKFDYMPIFYRASDIILLPSRFLVYASSDRSPNVALEALASGNVLIASHAGGIPTIVGDAAVLVRPNDAYALANKLRDVLINEDKYEHLKEKARERAMRELDVRCYVRDLLGYLKLSLMEPSQRA
jgi:glycosyltransferase involved in cell wall biosynthesis